MSYLCVCARYKYFVAWFAAQLVRFAFVDGFTPAQVHAEFAEPAPADALHFFGIVLPAVGFVACVLAGLCSTYFEVETTLCFGMALGLFNDGARVLSSSMGWWEAGMVAFAAYKGFVFSFLASFLLREYGCVCALCLFSAVCCFLCFLAWKSMSFVVANICMMALGVLSFAFWWHVRRDQRHVSLGR